jgi:hypothetical protein
MLLRERQLREYSAAYAEYLVCEKNVYSYIDRAELNEVLKTTGQRFGNIVSACRFDETDVPDALISLLFGGVEGDPMGLSRLGVKSEQEVVGKSFIRQAMDGTFIKQITGKGFEKNFVQLPIGPQLAAEFRETLTQLITLTGLGKPVCRIITAIGKLVKTTIGIFTVYDGSRSKIETLPTTAPGDDVQIALSKVDKAIEIIANKINNNYKKFNLDTIGKYNFVSLKDLTLLILMGELDKDPDNSNDIAKKSIDNLLIKIKNLDSAYDAQSLLDSLITKKAQSVVKLEVDDLLRLKLNRSSIRKIKSEIKNVILEDVENIKTLVLALTKDNRVYKQLDKLKKL